MQLVMFSKHLGPLSVPEAGKTIKSLGFDGVDLTVRPAGHVLPEDVKKALPWAVSQLKEIGLTVPMITTGIVDATDRHAADIMATAAEQGIGSLKLGYWLYRPFGTLGAQLEAARKAMDGIEGLARKHDIRASIHIHSGNYLSAVPGNLALLLKDRDPHHVGAYLDPGHMTLEGGASGWMQGIDLLQDYISMVAVKTFGHFPEKDAAHGDTRWRDKIVPLRDGIVRWREVFPCLRKLGWDGVVSFHSEYQGSHSWKDLNTEELVAQTRDDLAYLRPIIRAAGYAI
ncbi:MAG: sugar phosphate isomerase/epimerase family protein [Actinomycetota bacterium]